MMMNAPRHSGRASGSRRSATPATSRLFALTLLTIVGLLTLGTAFAASESIPLQDAIDAQRRSLASAPSADGYNDLGNLLGLSGSSELAEQAYRSALELDPERVDARYNLALLLQGHGESREALKLFRQVLKQQPDSAWAHFQVGLIQQEKGQRKAAIRSIARAFELEPMLAFADVNPQVIGNDAATAALLVAEVRATSAVPRVYSDPDRMRSLLTSDLDDPQGTANGENDEGAAMESEPLDVEAMRPRVDSSEISAEELENLPDGQRSSKAEMPEDPPSRDAIDTEMETAPSEPRRIDASSLQPAARINAAPRSQPTSGGTAGRSSRTDGRTNTTAPTGRPSSSRFRPGRRSNARLDWQLTPLEKATGESGVAIGAH